MQILDYLGAFEVLTTLPIVRVAVYDRSRQACYAVPLAFVPVNHGNGINIVLHANGRLARLLGEQLSGVCVEADDVKPNLAFRSVIGSAKVEALPQALPVLTALAGRYGAEWGRWRPTEPIQAFTLHLQALQGRVAD